MPTLDYHDKIAVLDLGGEENRFSPDFLEQVGAHLDTALADGAHGLVTTASGKFYSNGLDLDWLAAHGDRAGWYVEQVQALLARVLTLPVPTPWSSHSHDHLSAPAAELVTIEPLDAPNLLPDRGFTVAWA